MVSFLLTFLSYGNQHRERHQKSFPAQRLLGKNPWKKKRKKRIILSKAQQAGVQICFVFVIWIYMMLTQQQNLNILSLSWHADLPLWWGGGVGVVFRSLVTTGSEINFRNRRGLGSRRWNQSEARIKGANSSGISRWKQSHPRLPWAAFPGSL